MFCEANNLRKLYGTADRVRTAAHGTQHGNSLGSRSMVNVNTRALQVVLPLNRAQFEISLPRFTFISSVWFDNLNQNSVNQSVSGVICITPGYPLDTLPSYHTKLNGTFSDFVNKLPLEFNWSGLQQQPIYSIHSLKARQLKSGQLLTTTVMTRKTQWTLFLHSIC